MLREEAPEDFICRHDMPQLWCAICTGKDREERFEKLTFEGLLND